MTTRRELQMLSCLRLREAEVLFAAGLFEGCAYLCGYVVELGLKAAICATLGIEEYPETQLRGAFKTHEFDNLKLLAGMDSSFATDPTLLFSWSVTSEWTPERRYESQGTYDQASALEILEAVRRYPNGVLACISSRW
jgi:hypothetical protein